MIFWCEQMKLLFILNCYTNKFRIYDIHHFFYFIQYSEQTIILSNSSNFQLSWKRFLTWFIWAVSRSFLPLSLQVILEFNQELQGNFYTKYVNGMTSKFDLNCFSTQNKWVIKENDQNFRKFEFKKKKIIAIIDSKFN